MVKTRSSRLSCSRKNTYALSLSAVYIASVACESARVYSVLSKCPDIIRPRSHVTAFLCASLAMARSCACCVLLQAVNIALILLHRCKMILQSSSGWNAAHSAYCPATASVSLICVRTSLKIGRTCNRLQSILLKVLGGIKRLECLKWLIKG